MRFTKMEGLGNDFVVVDAPVSLDADLIRRLCDRHFGIGADGVLRVGRDSQSVVMDYWNADGSSSEMCGNGLRCVALYAYDRGLVDQKEFLVRTPVGLRRVEVGAHVRVELGPAVVADTISWGGITFHFVSVGNPHLVTLEADPDRVDVATIGAGVEGLVPGGANVGFGSMAGDALRLRVWERGVGETLACGSGMVAAASVAHHLGLAPKSVVLQVRGGAATVDIDHETTWLTGLARTVFTGEVATESE